MGKYHSKKLNSSALYMVGERSVGLLEDNFIGADKRINRKAYQPLLSLRQDYRINFDQSYNAMMFQKVV